MRGEMEPGRTTGTGAARASAKATRVTIEPLGARCTRLLHLELAAIASLEVAVSQEESPEYEYFMREAKAGHQVSAEQLLVLARLAGRAPAERAPLREGIAAAQTWLTQQVAGTTATLRAMRLVEEQLAAEYRALEAESDGLVQRAAKTMAERHLKHWHLITAHIAARGDAAEAERLPHPLSAYFANPEPRVCLRCLLDRPGRHPALEKKGDDLPLTYICAGCHDETLEFFPPDLQASLARWEEETRLNRVIQKAQGKTLKEAVKREAHAVLSALEPQPVRRALPRMDETNVARRHRYAPAPDAPPAALTLAREGASPDELAYSDLLFDFRSARRNW